jgi:hypothetical protein
LSSPNVQNNAAGPVWIHDDAAPADYKTWKLELREGRLVVETWNDERTWHDTIVLERKGPMLRVKLPVQADLSALYKQFPAIAHLTPIVVAHRRLIEAGAGEPFAPQLIHTRLALALWPIFGLHDPCPGAGAADFFGVRAVWAPALDPFAQDPDAK